MNITDDRLMRKANRAAALQAQGLFIVDYQRELPLPTHPSLTRLRYCNQRDECTSSEQMGQKGLFAKRHFSCG